MNAVHEPEVSEQVVPVQTGLEAQTRGEIDIQIATAKRYPRSVSKVMKEAMTLATLSEEIAEQCFYAVPRDGKTIEGPSARLAEIMASTWGHMRSEARIVEETDTHVVARGTSWDLERNVAVAFEVRRRITTSEKKDRNGKVIPSKKYGDDMITTTSNAANSIAYRNTVFRVIPKAFWQPIYEAARRVAIGDAETLVSKRTKMLAYFQRMGVPEARLLAAIKVAGVEDITLDHLATLKGIATALKEGDTTVDDAFPELTKEPQRMAHPEPSASAATETTAGAASVPASSPEAAPATTAPQAMEARVRVNEAMFDKARKVYQVDVTGDDTVPLGFVGGTVETKDEGLYATLAGIAGSDHFAAITFKKVPSKNGDVLVLLSADVEQAGEREPGSGAQ